MTVRIETNPDADEFDWAALGYTLHNLCTAMESYSGNAWHRSLVERIALEIPGVSPAVLTEVDRLVVDELMRFHHLFRNLYKTPLVPEKLASANRQASGIDKLITARHETFDHFLIARAESVDE
jgi:hypothetical protein